MKKLLLALILLMLVIGAGLYMSRSIEPFKKGIDHLVEERNIQGGLSIATLVNRYPYSPLTAVSKLIAVYQKPEYLGYIDLYYQSKSKRPWYEALMGRSAAFYDPYFFAALLFYILLTVIGVLQRYWVGSHGLGFGSIVRRDSFVLLILSAYVLWVRQAWEPGSFVNEAVGKLHVSLAEPAGIATVTLGFSALLTMANLLALICAGFGFFGKPK